MNLNVKPVVDNIMNSLRRYNLQGFGIKGNTVYAMVTDGIGLYQKEVYYEGNNSLYSAEVVYKELQNVSRETI
jgi:hypothetical protein